MVGVVAALTFRDYGLGWDDFTHAQYGDLLLSLYTSGFRDTRALSFVNLYLYGGGFDMAAALLAKVSAVRSVRNPAARSAPRSALLGLAITWRIGRRIGGPLAGLLALVLLATCPLYYGHMFMNPKDAPFAVAMALFLLGLVRLLDQYPKPCPTTLFIVGLGFGLSIGSRILAGFGVLEAIGALALLFAIEARAGGIRAAGRRLGHLLLVLIPSAILAYAVMALIWPWGVAHPLNPLLCHRDLLAFLREALARAVRRHADRAAGHAAQLCADAARPQAAGDSPAAGRRGRHMRAVRGVSCKESPPRLRAMVFRHRACRRSADRRDGDRAPGDVQRRPAFRVRAAAARGRRRTGRGLDRNWIASHTARFGRPALAALALIFAAGVALPAIGMARLHPYEYASYNHIAGGVRGAQPRFMLDYWGLAFKQAGEELRAKLALRGETPPAGRKWRIAVCGPHPPARIALGDQFEPTWDPKGADFALMLGVFYCARLDAPLLAEVVRDGVSFARAYDIRGRTISTLFTQPPVKRD